MEICNKSKRLEVNVPCRFTKVEQSVIFVKAFAHFFCCLFDPPLLLSLFVQNRLTASPLLANVIYEHEQPF